MMPVSRLPKIKLHDLIVLAAIMFGVIQVCSRIFGVTRGRAFVLLVVCYLLLALVLNFLGYLNSMV